MKIVFCLLFLIAVTRVPRVQSEHSLDVFKMYQLIQTMEDLFKDANNLTAGFSCEGKSFQDCYKSILNIYKTSIEGEILKVINNTVVSYLTRYKQLVLQYIHFNPSVADENYSLRSILTNIHLKDSQLECVIGLLSVFKVPINDKLKEYVFYNEEKEVNDIDHLKVIVKSNYEGEDIESHLNTNQFNLRELHDLKSAMTTFSSKVCTTIQANWIKADLWVWRKVQKSHILSQNINDAQNLLAWQDQIFDDGDDKPSQYNYEYLVDKPVLKVCQTPTATADQAGASGSDPMQHDQDDIDGPDPRSKRAGTSEQQPTMSMQCTLFNVQHQFVDLVLSLCGNQPYAHFRHSSEYRVPEPQPGQAGQDQDETYENSYMRELSQTLMKVESSVFDVTPVKEPTNGNPKQTMSLKELFDKQYSYYNNIDDFHHEVASTIDRYVSKVIFSKVLRLIIMALINYKTQVNNYPEDDASTNANLEKYFVEYFYLGQQLMVFKTVLELYISRGPITLSDETINDMNDILDFAITKYLYHVIRMDDPQGTADQIAKHLSDKRFLAALASDLRAPIDWQVQFDEIKQINMYVNELVEIKGQN